MSLGGAGGTRTPDPLNAIEMLCLLSYSPTVSISKIVAGRQTSDAGCPDPVTRTTVQLLRFTEDSACCPPLSVAESQPAIAQGPILPRNAETGRRRDQGGAIFE